MDNGPSRAPDPSRAPTLTFSPDRRYTALAGVGVLAALVALALAGDRPGRLLAGTAVVVLLIYVVCDLVFAPRLVASAEGIVVRSPLVRARLSWPEVEDVRADTRIRLGLRSTTLEIDAGETLVVLSTRSLGADPGEVAALVRALRP